ncbi:MAG TPA: DUF6412 domain-containing protein [Jiangellaceae bacterium]
MLAVVGLLFEVLAGPVGVATELAGTPAGMAAIVVAAAAVLLPALVGAVHAVPVRVSLIASAVRQRAERTVFLPLCDPDAQGRPRPRAPSVRPGLA